MVMADEPVRAGRKVILRNHVLSIPLLGLLACATASPAARLGLPGDTRLPGFAGALAGALPATTVSLLELDRLHRVDHPLGAAFAARLRLAVASALRSPALAGAARADLQRAGQLEAPPPEEAGAVALARSLATSAAAVDDAQFAAVLASFGPERTMAIVHTVAYASFLVRLSAGLGTDDLTPLPPPGLRPLVPTRVAGRAPRPGASIADPGLPSAARWTAAAFADLQAGKVARQAVSPRLPPPEPIRFERLTERERKQVARITWSALAYGYQPELTRAWFRCLHTFYAEADIDAVLENSMFWIVTRTNDCFY
jgi:hypothetical protein